MVGIVLETEFTYLPTLNSLILIYDTQIYSPTQTIKASNNSWRRTYCQTAALVEAQSFVYRYRMHRGAPLLMQMEGNKTGNSRQLKAYYAGFSSLCYEHVTDSMY